MSIRNKTITLILLVSIIPLSIVGITALQITKNSLTKQIGADSLEFTRLIKNSVNEYLFSRFSELRNLTKFEVLEYAMTLGQEKSLSQFLVALSESFDDYFFIAYINKKGEMVSTNPLEANVDYSSLSGFKEAITGKDYISELEYVDIIEEYAFSLFIPFRDPDDPREVIGVVTAIVKWENILKLITEIPLKGKKQDIKNHIMLLKRDGVITACYDRTKIFSKNLVKEKLVSAINAVQGKEGSILEKSEHGNTSFSTYTSFSRYKGLPETGWMLIIYEDPEELFQSVERLQTVIVGGFFLTAIVLGLFAVGLSRRLTTPILQIAAAAKDIGEGNLEMQIPVLSEDEVGELAASFNKMALDLKTSRQELLFSKEYMEGVLMSMMDPLIVVDSKWAIQTVNKVTGTLLGYEDEYLKNSHVSNLLEELDFPDNAEFSPKMRSFKFETFFRSKDGKKIPIFLSGSVIIDKIDGYQGIIYVAHDITELKDAEKEKQNRRDLVLKTQFLEEEDWLKTGTNKLSKAISGIQDANSMAEQIILFLVNYLKVSAGKIFFSNPQTDELEFIYERGQNSRVFFIQDDWENDETLQSVFRTGKRIILKNRGKEHNSDNVNELARYNVVTFPLRFENSVFGIIQLLSKKDFTRIEWGFINQAEAIIGASLDVLFSRLETESLLSESRTLSYELKTQSEKLKKSNILLSEQTFELKKTQHDLKKRNVELEEAQNDLELRAKQLELVSKYKSEFLANMSHELRTPLNSILILSNILMVDKPGSLSEDQKKHARTINGAGSNLLKQINNVLDISKIEAGHMDTVCEEFFLESYLNSFCDLFSPVAEEKGISMKVTIGEDLPEKIFTDQEKLKQVISNMLSNAIKFTHEGRVELTAFCNKKTAPESLFISIRDTGIGIPADKKELIFEPFRQVDGSISRKFGGTGLGLSISRKIARLLGGDLTLKNSDESGSTFLINILLKTSKKEDRESEINKEPELPLISEEKDHKKEVLLLKNIPQIIKNENEFLDKQLLFLTKNFKDSYTLAAALEPKGFDVKLATTEEAALDCLEKGEINVLFVDAYDPNSLEVESLMEEKKKGFFKSVLFIQLENSDDKKDDVSNNYTDICKVLTKPVDFNDLLTLLRDWF